MSDLDDESIEFLRAAQRLGGEARSDQIRIESGLSADQRDRRFSKLEDRGYILVDTADEPINGGGYPPRYATLTDKARRFLRDLGDDEDDTGEDTVTVSRTQIEEFSEQLDRLQSRVDTLTQTVIPSEPDENDEYDVTQEDIVELWKALDGPIRNRLERLEREVGVAEATRNPDSSVEE